MLQNQDIIAITATFWDGAWLSNHQYMRGLAAHGNRVLYVERPVSLVSALSPNPYQSTAKQIKRWLDGGLREGVENLWVGSPPPVAPFRFEKPVNVVNQFLRADFVRRTAKKLGFKDPILWIYEPDAGWMVKRSGEKLALYAITDDHLTMTQRINRISAMRARETELLKRVDLVIATADNLREIKGVHNPNTHYVPHGIDHAVFAQALDPATEPMPDMAGISGPVIAVVGQINQRVDVATMTEMARRHPDWTLIFIGPVVRERVDVSALESLPNVRFLGRKSAEELPRYLKSADACLIPYLVDEHTRYMHPLKTLEYLAAGRPVIASPLPALKIYDGHISIAGDSDSFIAAVERELASDTPEKRLARSAYAAQHTWDERLEKISGLIEATLAKKGVKG